MARATGFAKFAIPDNIQTIKKKTRQYPDNNQTTMKKILFCFSFRLASIMGPKLFFLDSVTRRSNGNCHVVCEVRPFWPPPKKKLMSDNMKKKLMKKIIVLFFLQIGINNGTKTFFSRFCDHTVKWRVSRGLRSSTILATTQEKVGVG